MASATIKTAKRFASHEGGAVAIIFGLMAMSLFFVIGLAIDIGRAIHTDQRLTAAMDAAALAAGRALIDTGKSDDEIRTLALEFVRENLGTGGAGFGNLSELGVTIDRGTGTVRIETVAVVPATITKVARFDNFRMQREAAAAFDQKDIELALALDITGSMRGQKIEDLKAAAAQLVVDLLHDHVLTSKVRIGIAPYSTAINLGPYAAAASNNRSTDRCVYERTGANAYTDARPGAGAYFLAGGRPVDIDPTEGRYAYECPSSVIQPLTDNLTALTTAIANLRAQGGTAGHFGAAWGWNLVSEKWATFWPAASAPAAADIAKTTKAIVLMSDGTFNTAFANGRSADQAIALCTAMKGTNSEPSKHDVVVYAIGFQAPAASEATLRACASSERHYYSASDGAELSQVFLDISRNLKGLRLTQ